MSAKETAARKKAMTVAADDPELKRAEARRRQSPHWNNVLVRQTIDTLWLKYSDEDTCDRQIDATVAALMGIEPRDELKLSPIGSQAPHPADSRT